MRLESVAFVISRVLQYVRIVYGLPVMITNGSVALVGDAYVKNAVESRAFLTKQCFAAPVTSNPHPSDPLETALNLSQVEVL